MAAIGKRSRIGDQFDSWIDTNRQLLYYHPVKTWTVPGLGIQSYGLVRDLSPTYSYNRQRCHERINILTCNPLGFQVREWDIREWDKISVIYLALESIQGYFNLESIFGYKHRNNAFDKTLTHSDASWTNLPGANFLYQWRVSLKPGGCSYSMYSSAVKPRLFFSVISIPYLQQTRGTVGYWQYNCVKHSTCYHTNTQHI